ncbi:hypothetical protein RUM43_003223 [Polyplax serrata]|uniref:Uncharacterized protein n=1 Tax=Polyplax serrata TaxID=468196 RepID=A0AAN8S9C7_POLSC
MDKAKTLLLVTSHGSASIFPFLFEFTKYWATRGRQLLYISKTRIESLPPSLGETGHPDVEILKLLQFMYLSSWKDLLYQLATIRIRGFRVCAIVVDNLADYFDDKPEHRSYEDHVSCVCANLLFAIQTISKNNPGNVALLCGYVSQNSTIERNVIKNFFHNVWEIKSMDDKTLSVVKRTKGKLNEIVSFTYRCEDNFQSDKDQSNSKMNLIEIIKKVIEE